jgi:betaine-aldehyde dehydrogenase
MAPVDRATIVAKLAGLYAARIDDFAELITAEMGSPITFSQVAQAQRPQLMLSYFADLGKTFAWEDDRPGMFGPVTVRREPVGVVAAIMPWNVPQFTTISKLAPALVAGCTVVLKPAPETPLDAYLLAELIHEAGVSPGVVNVVPAGRETGEYLVSHPGVDKVAFTGSTAAGQRVGSICGQQVKRCSLELGGKSAAIILDDADLAATVGRLEMASLMNNGQACVAQTRILASRSRYDETVEALVAMVSGLTMGDPADPGTKIGPACRKTAARPGGGVHQGRTGRGSEGCDRRLRCLGAAEGLVCRAHGVRRGGQLNADRTRGDLRPGARCHSVRRRRRRDTHRQRQRLRSRWHRVDRRY